MTYQSTESIAQTVAADLACDTSEGLIARRCVTHMTLVLGWPNVSVRAMLPELYPLARACVRAKAELQ
jgi:hypothetical protein